MSISIHSDSLSSAVCEKSRRVSTILSIQDGLFALQYVAETIQLFRNLPQLKCCRIHHTVTIIEVLRRRSIRLFGNIGQGMDTWLPQ